MPIFKRDTVSYLFTLNIGGAILKFYRGYNITLLFLVINNYNLIIIRNFNRLLIKYLALFIPKKNGKFKILLLLFVLFIA